MPDKPELPPIRRGVMIEVPLPEPPAPKRPPAKWRMTRPTKAQVHRAMDWLKP